MERIGETRNWRRKPTGDPPYLAAKMVQKAGPPLKFVPEQWEDPAQGTAILEQSAYELLLQRTRLRGEPQPDVWENLQATYLKQGEISKIYDPAIFLDDSFIEAANDYTTAEVKEALKEWREANQEYLTP